MHVVDPEGEHGKLVLEAIRTDPELHAACIEYVHMTDDELRELIAERKGERS